MALASAFVTGATGLLGNNLVRLLRERGVRVTALVRSREKAMRMLGDSDLTIVEGDMGNVPAFADRLAGHDVLFHTAAYFRDSYKGGRHRDALLATNVAATEALLGAAYATGIRRFVHTSSIAVLDGPRGSLIDETMPRRIKDADDYYASKILADRAVKDFLERHPDMDGCFVLPGFMFGPGDAGPTAAGQIVLDHARRKLPGIPPGGFSVVDARDVALAEVAAAEKGRRGELYLAAGRPMTMAELVKVIEHVTGVPAPRRKVPYPMLYLLGMAEELGQRLFARPALVSLATVRLMRREEGRYRFSDEKSSRELDLSFRPVEETLADVVRWYRRNGWLAESAPSASDQPRG
ncbi:SDR family oxidoreductase [Kaistia geumhonensis]|uniref:Dihydroflavonol-4-reductase n=1 Tax=Kaistia geumhonensis TaxID=410839 RepID=A0ABU0M4Y3_9HYPH|nr:SDR family oxidoreductase [Kaistia geumhonensis]MCX5478757.1 SDR family oxidoreductase [Kaistia geumhonensis]MDQ0516024.1 dihydroflavonol-4-reductase [Kaistia geumhonensis]